MTALPSPPAAGTTIRPPAPPPVAPPRVTPAPTPPPRRTTLRIALATVLVAALVAGTIVVVALTGGGGPSVRELRLAQATATTVTLRWGPPEGARPARYLVTRDGGRIGTTAATRFSDRGVQPGTRYTYGVVPVVDGAEGTAAEIVVRTALPPVGDATLRGGYRVRFRVTSATGWESIGAGDRDTVTWRVTDGGRRLHGASLGGTWTMTLERVGARASGTTTAALSACQFVPVTDTVTVRLEVTAGRMIDGAWVATRFRGTVRDTAPAASVGLWRCPGSTYTAEVAATRWT